MWLSYLSENKTKTNTITTKIICTKSNPIRINRYFFLLIKLKIIEQKHDFTKTRASIQISFCLLSIFFQMLINNWRLTKYKRKKKTKTGELIVVITAYLKKFLIMVRRFPLVGVVGVVTVLVVLVGGVGSPIDNFNPLVLN